MKSFEKIPIIFVLYVRILKCQEIDWCNIENCRPNSHIACRQNVSFSDSCVTPTQLYLTDIQVQRILDLHNGRRNLIASGGLKPFNSAVRMAKLKWNVQLAWLAEILTKSCEMKHDDCHNTPCFVWSGQNLAVVSNTATYTIDQVINSVMRIWFAEYPDATPEDIDKFDNKPDRKGQIGHFTMMMTDRATHVGCAISTFQSRSNELTFNNYLMACNYASTNMYGCQVYKTGSPASNCTTGPDSLYQSLCSENEKYDDVKSFCSS